MLENVEYTKEVNKENENLVKGSNVDASNQNSPNSKTAPELLSPPKKKFKQDSIPFPKLSKEDALKDTAKSECATKNEHIKEAAVKEDCTGIQKSTGEGDCNDVQQLKSPISTKKPICNRTPVSTPTMNSRNAMPQSDSKSKKTSPFSKEERQRAKELKDEQKLQRQKELEEKKKKKEEEKALKQMEKEKREQERKEKERIKEEEKKRKEEEKRLKDEEKRKKDIEKEDERRKKEEQREIERRKKEVEREKKEAEREKKEVERKQKEEQKRQEDEKKKLEEEAQRKKKQKAANQFKSFFKQKSAPVEEKITEGVSEQRFQPFQLKPNMTLAPIRRREEFDRKCVDKVVETHTPDLPTFLEDLAVKLANSKRKPLYKTRRQLRREWEEQRKQKLQINNKKDVIIIDEDAEDDEEDSSFQEQQLMKAILIQFSENTRPPYFGTWNKKTKFISGRKPFKLDTDVFNYDIDSDEEWVDEPGEDCSDNADEDDDDEKETEDDQDGFFVPHGYLSDDEGVKDSDEEEDEKDDEEIVDKKTNHKNDKEDREQEKLRNKVCSFEVTFKKKLKPRKPICFGISYTIENLPIYLKEYGKVELYKTIDEKGDNNDMEIESPSCVTQQKTKKITYENGCQIPKTVPEEAMSFLVRLIHGNSSSLHKMSNTFKDFWSAYVAENNLKTRSFISKKRIEKKFTSIATRIYNDKLGKYWYVVKPEFLEKYNLIDLKLSTGLPPLQVSLVPMETDAPSTEMEPIEINTDSASVNNDEEITEND